MVFFNNQTFDFPVRYTTGKVKHIFILNDGANSLTFSSDGSNTIGIVKATEGFTFDFLNECSFDFDSLYIKSTALGAATTFRLWAW